MRLIGKLMAATSALVLTTATRAVALVQDAKIEVHMNDHHGMWYTQPVWIAIGIIALVLVIALIAMAGRRNNTTIVK